MSMAVWIVAFAPSDKAEFASAATIGTALVMSNCRTAAVFLQNASTMLASKAAVSPDRSLRTPKYWAMSAISVIKMSAVAMTRFTKARSNGRKDCIAYEAAPENK